MARIVVGIDGSNRSKDALRWAAAEAQLTGATLEVVMVWHRLNPDAWVPHEPPGTDPLAVTRRALEGIVRGVLGEHPTITVETRAAEGAPAKVLLEAAEDADLLVVGNRGYGGFTGLLLGSIGLHCVTHATCPVVVVRPTGRHESGS